MVRALTPFPPNMHVSQSNSWTRFKDMEKWNIKLDSIVFFYATDESRRYKKFGGTLKNTLRYIYNFHFTRPEAFIVCQCCLSLPDTSCSDVETELGRRDRCLFAEDHLASSAKNFFWWMRWRVYNAGEISPRVARVKFVTGGKTSRGPAWSLQSAVAARKEFKILLIVLLLLQFPLLLFRSFETEIEVGRAYFTITHTNCFLLFLCMSISSVSGFFARERFGHASFLVVQSWLCICCIIAAVTCMTVIRRAV